MNDQINIVIYIEEGGLQEEAFALSQKTGIPISDTPGEALTLLFDASGFSLVGYGMRYQGDFEQMLYRVSSGRLHHEMLVKAAKTKSEHPVAFDATAGMGEDAFLLAAMGYEVVLFEQNPIVAALLQDAMSRARRHPDLRVVINRMKLIHGDSIALMPTLEAGGAAGARVSGSDVPRTPQKRSDRQKAPADPKARTTLRFTGRAACGGTLAASQKDRHQAPA